MHRVIHIAIGLAATVAVGVAQEANQYPLGPIGGNYRVSANSSLAMVSNITAGGPGASAGLQTGDYIYGAYGKTFTPTGNYHYGVSQELGFAVDRAEGSDGILPLMVIRPGTGGLTINVNLSTPGSFGVAYPRNSSKYSAIYETAVADLHTRSMNGNGNLGYLTGWAGLALLGHPNWNDTTGAKPYRLSINKIRDYIINQLYNSNYAPNEDLLLDGTSNPNFLGGMSNWELGQKVMFLAEYWAKTADPNPVTITVGGTNSTVTVNQALQRGNEMCGNSVQWWKQPAMAGNGFSPEYAQVAGMSSHGGVTGDYMHQGWYCGINITGVHAFNGMAFARRAGMDMTVRPKDGHYFGYNLNPGDPIPTPIANALPASITLPQYGADPVQGSTINNPFYYDPSTHQKFAMMLNFIVRRSGWYSAGNNDDGMVGYAPEAITAYDAAGRTAGALLAMAMYNQDVGGLDAADQNRMESMKGYITRNYMRHQESHAFCVGGQAFQAFCAPYLSDRQQRFFMDNWRFFFALSRTSSNGIQYYPSRGVADNYLDYATCASINIALPYGIANGGYSLVPAYNTNRSLANFKSPVLMWPSLAARACTVNTSSQDFQVDVCDGNGNVLAPSAYTCTWSHVSGPATATFSSVSAANTTVTLPMVSATPYRIRLTVSRAGVPDLTEDIDVTRANAPTPVPNALVSHPVSRTTVPGGNATFSVSTTGDGPFLYQWRLNGVSYWGNSTTPALSLTNVSTGHAGTYDCVVSTPTGTFTSNPATLTLAVNTSITTGGLKREVWDSVSGSAVSDLTGLSTYPLFPNSTGTVTTFEAPASYGDSYGQKLSGWIVPPTTGQYKFFIASDDASELWLSTDSSAANKVKIAQLTGWASSRSYSSGGQSAFITLTAGQRYYVEALHKEGGGGDNLAVAWQLPGGAVPANGSAPIDGVYLQYESVTTDPNYNGLVSWWKLDETTGTLAGDTLSSNDGTVYNGASAGATWATGKHLGGLAFDGNDKVMCTNVGALGGATAFTVSAWVKVPAGNNTDGVIIQQRASNGYNGQYRLSVTAAGKVNFYVYGNSAQQFNFVGTTSINDGLWHHVAGTRDTLGNAWIYVDGVQNGSVSGTTVRSLDSTINIGLGADIRDSITFFKGVMDDVRVYNRLLSASEVSAIQNRAPSFAVDPVTFAATEDAAITGSIAATDMEGDAVTYSKVSGPAWLAVASSGALSGTPTNNEVGVNAFAVRATDSHGAATDATLNVVVANTNDAPVWSANPIDLTGTEDVAVTGQLAATDVDTVDTLTYSKVSGPSWLAVSSSGTLSGTPLMANIGANAFTVRVFDGTTTVDATLNVTVASANDAPVWSADPINMPAVESYAFTGQLAATDEEGDPLTYSKVSGPTWLSVSSTGALTGTPGAGTAGVNAFTVSVSDGIAAPVNAVLNIAVNQGPTWSNLAGGSWPTAGNWVSGAVASGTGTVADFASLDLSATATVTLDGARTVGGLKFGDLTPSHGWVLSTGTGGALTLAVPSGTPAIQVVNQDATLNAVLAGTQGLSKTGAGTLVLGAANTFTGGVTVSQGILKLGNASALGTSAATVASGGSLDVSSFAPTNALNISGSGNGTLPALYNSGGAGAAAATLSSAITLGADATAGNFATDSIKMLRLSGALNFGVNKLTLPGGAVAISIRNIPSGNIDINNGGTLYSDNGGSLTSTTGTIAINTGGKMETRDTDNSAMTGVHTIALKGGQLGTATITSNNGGGAGTILKNNITVDATSGGILNGNNTAFGIYLRLSGALSGTGPLTLTGAKGVEFRGDTSAYTGTATANNGTVSFNPSAASQTFAGVLAGSRPMVKSGTNTTVLTAANTYTGTTTVSAGTLLVNGSLGASATTVSAGAKLGGTGNIGGAVSNSGTLAPGNNAAGKLTVNNALTLGTASSVAWEVSDWSGTAGAGYDSVTANSLNITATSVSPATITITQPSLVNFSETSKSFTLVQTTGGITGFDPTKFSINSTGFTAGAGTWSVQQSGNNLMLVYTRTNTAPVFASNPIAVGASEDSALSGQLAASDPDLGETLTFAKVSGPAWLTVSPTGALSGTPTNAEVGLNTFIVSVTDSFNASATATLNVTVANTNDAPVFAADPINLNATEDSAFTGQLSASDVDAGATLTYSKVSGPAWLTVSSSGALSGTPTNSEVGANSFVVRVSDGTANVDAALNVTVANTNDAPVFAADPINQNATEDSALTGQLVATDVDAGDTLSYSKVSGPAWLTVSSSGALSGTPTNSEVGVNICVVRVSDGTASADATLNVTVANTNDAPEFAAAQLFRADASTGSAYAGQTLAGSASDVDSGDTLAYSKVSGPAWLTVASDGALGGTPSAGDVGDNDFIVRVSDAGGASGDTALRIKVVGSMLAWWTFNEGTGVTASDASGNGRHATLQGATWAMPRDGYAAVATNGSSSQYVQAPSLDTVGGLTIAAWIKPAALSGHRALVSEKNSYVFKTNGSGLLFTTPGILDHYSSGVTLVANTWTHVAVSFQPGTTGGVKFYVNGVLASTGNASSMNQSIEPTILGNTTNWTGQEFNGALDDVRVYGGILGGTAIAEIYNSYPAAPAPVAPVFASDPITGSAATEDGAYSATLAGSASDADVGDTLSYSKVSGPAWLSVAGNGALSGTPDNSNVGNNVFVVRVTDSVGLTDDAVLNIQVNNTNDAPVWAADPINQNATEDSAFTGQLAATDVDAGDTLTYSKVSGPAWLTVSASGALSGTPTNSEVGANSFVVQVNDGIASVTAALNVTVANTNDAPVFAADPINQNATEDSTFTGQLAATDVDAGDTLTYSKVSGPAWLTVSSTGALSGTPTNSEVGANSFVVRVSDGTASADATLNVTVANTNDAPVWTASPMSRADGSVGVAYSGQTLAGAATDADAGATLSYSKVSGPAWLTVAANGALGGTPDSGSVGANSFVVRVSDGTATADATLNITVVGLPSPWVSADVGTTGLAGSASHSGGVFTVAGAGLIGGTTSDAERYVYQTLSGDGSIVARISTLGATGGTSARVGIQIRDTLAANSKALTLAVNGSGAFKWMRRTTAGGSTSNTNSSSGTAPNIWVKLERVGNVITASKSTNGTSWTTIGSVTVTLTTNCYIGLVDGSGSTTSLNTSNFDNVTCVP